MCQKYTEEELNTMNHDAKNAVICQMQERLDKLEHDYERLMEQIRLANQERFGRHTEKLNEIAGQLSFFNEIDNFFGCHGCSSLSSSMVIGMPESSHRRVGLRYTVSTLRFTASK